MTVVKINALEIPPQAGDEIVKRFTARLGSLADVPGFEGFELLRPTGDTETRWFVNTRWADQTSYEGWRDGDGARQSHAASVSDSDGPAGGGSDGGDSHGGSGVGPDKPGERQRPVSMGATLLEFEVEVSAGPSGTPAG